jgi:hypothetical protein
VPLKLIDTVDDRAAGGDQSGRLALPARCLPRSLRREEIEGSPDDEQLPNRHINFDAAIRSADARSARAIPRSSAQRYVICRVPWATRASTDFDLHRRAPRRIHARRPAADTHVHDG